MHGRRESRPGSSRRRWRHFVPGGVVAISVPAGPMRCPPGPFERASLMAGYFKRRNPRAKVMILDANNQFPKQDVFTRCVAGSLSRE